MANFETTTKYVRGIESRYKKISNLNADMSVFPIKANQITQVKTDIAKSKEFGEVFTPLWLVDMMISQTKIKSQEIKTLDLCAGYGQFSIRLMRYFYNKFDKNFDLKVFLKNHYFSELQLISCYKLLWIFGKQINLFIGDATKLHLLPEDAEGIWCYLDQVGKWVCLNKTIQKIFMPKPKQTISEEEFVFLIKKIIDELNKEYKKMEDRYSEIRRNKKARENYIRRDFLSNPKVAEHLIQKHLTPDSIVEDMCNQIDELEIKNILVMFNWEFLEHLVFDKEIDPSKITFAGELEIFNKILAKLYGVNYIVINAKDIANLQRRLANNKFDVCLSNPPYNKSLDLKILQGCITNSIAKEYVWVHPSTWLMDQKDAKDLFINVKSLLTDKVTSIRLFNGNPVFEISLHVPCEIIHINHNSNKIKIDLMGDKFDASSLDEVTKFGSSWQDIVLPFKKIIQKTCNISGNVWSHVEKSVDNNKFYYQCAGVRGHEDYKPKSMVKDDFYTISPKDTNVNKGIRKPLNYGNDNMPAFGFSSEKERDNFLQYLNTDFVRFCLSLLKNNQNIHRGEMALIPWLDFTQSWDDEKLFKHFNIDQKTQDYIGEFLPDYYGIRKQKPNKDGDLTNAA